LKKKGEHMKHFLIASLLFIAGFTAHADEHIRGGVVGIGSVSYGPEYLFSRGWDAAIMEARTCKITGHFTSGSDCYLLYDTGWSEWVSGFNRERIDAFIDQLQRIRTGGGH